MQHISHKEWLGCRVSGQDQREGEANAKNCDSLLLLWCALRKELFGMA